MWGGGDLSHQKVFRLGTAWVNDCVYLPHVRKLACATADHAVRLQIWLMWRPALSCRKKAFPCKFQWLTMHTRS